MNTAAALPQARGEAQSGNLRTLILAALLCCLIVEWGILLPILKDRSLDRRADFPVFYRAAVIAGSIDGRQLYDAAVQGRYIREPATSGGSGNPPGGYFYHLPFELLIMLPLGFLPYPAAFWVWTAFNAACILLAAHSLRPEFPTLDAAVPLPLLAFVFFPTLYIFFCGQDSGVLFLLVALAYRQFLRGHEVWAGALLALGLFKFQYILPLVAVLALRRCWKVCFSFTMTTASLLDISWAMIGTSGVLSYWRLLQHHGPETAEKMANLRGLVQSLGGSPVIAIVLSVALLVYAGCRSAETRSAQFRIAIVAALLVSFHGHMYDFVLLLIPLFVALESATGKRLISCWPALFFISPLFVVGMVHESWYLWTIPIFTLDWNIHGVRVRTSIENNPQPGSDAPFFLPQ